MEKIKKNCKVCNKEFLVYPSLNRITFCSRKCYWLTRKGKHFSPTTEFKKGKYEGYGFKKGFTPWNIGRKVESMRNEKHFNWKGNKVGYRALHSWIVRKMGKAIKCEFCGKTAPITIQWANKSHKYKRNLSDWLQLCVPCHKEYDKKL